MNEEIRVPENKYFNNSFKDLLHKFFGSQIYSQKFKEINFAYLFNLPAISIKGNEFKIRINEDIENFKWDKDFINSIEIRKKQIIMQLQKEGYNLENLPLSISWRLVIGLGASHPQETSMTLHHIYGIPYIPGSAIKGVTRHWAVLKFAEKKNKTEDMEFEKDIEKVSNALEKGEDLELEVEKITFKDLIEIFGTQEKQGKVIFFDAYPFEEIRLKIDVMNPHYPKYYLEGQPPADWQTPVPIKFLTVENTKFQFYLASKEQTLVEKARSLLLETIQNYGIGAKTSLGYGIFINADKL
jgi:CRISPR-associated protein Cmr6